MKKIILLLPSMLMLSSFSLYAGKYTIYEMSDLDLSMLPAYCVSWARGDEKATDAWVAKLQISNIHHFCKGLKHVNRAAIAMNKQDKLFNIKMGKAEFDYVLKHAKGSSFPLKPFLLVNRAKLHVTVKEYDKAISDYKEAITLSPKFIRPYLRLIDLYTQMGNKKEALHFLNEGLSHVPKSKPLLRRGKKLKH